MFFGPIEKTRWPPWPLIGWDIFDFSSETAERNSTKLDRKQDLNVLYEVCVFQADRKYKMAALASDWLRHFRLLFWNCGAELNETWQEARSQRPLSSLCFSGRSEKQDGRPGLWLAESYSTSSLKPLNGIQRNLTGSKISTSSTKFVFFGPIGKTRWLPWPLIGRDIFDFFSETAERNSTKLDRKQDLNVLYQVCVFRADRKTRWPPWPLTGWDIFDFFSETAERNSTKLNRKQDLNVLYQVCVFRTDRKNKMAALASDWLSHIRLLLWNRLTEFNETWQEARSQRLLPSSCFSGRSENKMAALANQSKRWHIVLRCTICGPLGLLFLFLIFFIDTQTKPFWKCWVGKAKFTSLQRKCLSKQFGMNLKEHMISFHKLIKKYISSSSKFTSRFLLWWCKMPWQYKPEKIVKSKTSKTIIKLFISQNLLEK